MNKLKIVSIVGGMLIFLLVACLIVANKSKEKSGKEFDELLDSKQQEFADKIYSSDTHKRKVEYLKALELRNELYRTSEFLPLPNNVKMTLQAEVSLDIDDKIIDLREYMLGEEKSQKELD